MTSSNTSKHSRDKKKCEENKCLENRKLLKLLKKEIYKYELADDTLVFSGCVEIPELIKSYFNLIGYNNLKKIIEAPPKLNNEVLDRAYAIDQVFSEFNLFKHKHKQYKIRMSLFFSTGQLFYDSLLYTSDQNNAPIDLALTIANFPEVLRSTQIRWSLMQRTVTLFDEITITMQFFSFWIPLVEIISINNNTLGEKNNEVVCIRFGIEVDQNGKPVPYVVE